MMAKESPETAQIWLELIGQILYAFINAILLDKTNPMTVLETIISTYKADQGASLFSVSATTLNNDLTSYPKHDADRLLSSQVDQIEGKLRKEGLWSRDIMVAIDPSDIIYRGKYHNQYTPWGYCGQKDTYRRGFKEIMHYVNPGALIAASTQASVITPLRCDRDLPLWIAQCQGLIQEERSRGTTVRLFEGDREFYSALGFAFSRYGLWNPNVVLTDNPRFLVPMKMGESTEIKWAFLLNPKSPIVEETEISLDFYQEKFLESVLAKLPANQKGTKHLVPTASVAVFDAYPNRHTQQTMEWANVQAKTIELKLTELTASLAEAEQDFCEYLEQIQQYKWKKGKRGSSTRKISPPTYIGKRRTVFKDLEEKNLYKKCCQIYDRIQEWQDRKTNLCKRLMFFMISLYEGDSIQGKEAEFTRLVKEYHERWAIENGFKAIKYQFYIKTNSRSACGRHARWIMSCMVYNAWHYWRLIRVARNKKKTDPKWKPFDRSLNPPIRKKYERKFHPILSAQGYLVEELTSVLKKCIKILIQAL